ncbi:HET domain containing protein [Elaphomyces granulatus]
MSLDCPESAFELRTLGNNCLLCNLLLNVVRRGDYQQVPIIRDHLTFTVTTDGPCVFRLCTALGSSLPPFNVFNYVAYYFVLAKEPSTDGSYGTKTGPLILQTINLFQIRGALYFQLLREWLRECDQSHKCNRPTQSQNWPTRVIFVGGPDPNKLILQEQVSEEDYLVLSHCWGNPTDEERKRFCTTSENYHAVRVTRELGKEYLWIDSLCIIQEDKEDWKREAERMEHVFASAYCTIAASSASNWRDGFLERNLSPQYFQIQSSSCRQVYVCGNMHDYSKDMDESPLNKRAWVLQERVLSRRTIHFSAKQTYWECAGGVLCENFIGLHW